MTIGIPLVATLFGVAALVLLHRYERSYKKRTRALFFFDCLDLLQSYRVTQDDISYPLLVGRYRGYDIRMEPVIDHMAWRKLPVLWLKVTVLTEIPYSGVVDLLMRPHGAENFTPSSDLEYPVKLPENWPQDGLLNTDDPDGMPPLDLIAPHLGLFADDKMKELVVTPNGVRLVARIWQAVRANYVTFREIKFMGDRIDRELARELLDGAIAISRSLAETKLPARSLETKAIA
jgi:hypothetical protein